MADDPKDDELLLTDDQIIGDDPDNQDEKQEDGPDGGDDAADEAAEETVISFGEEEGAPPSEERDTGLVRDLRAKLREKERELTALRKSSVPQEIEVGEKPTLAACDYDEERFETELFAWNERKAEADKQNAAQSEAAEKAEAEWQSDLGTFAEQKTALRMPDYEDAEDEVVNALNQVQQAVVVKAANNKAAVVYALGKNKAKLAELAKITDPIKLAVAVSKLEGELKVTTRRKAPPPEEVVSGSGSLSATSGKSAIEKEIERLEAKAARDPGFDRGQIAKLRRQLRALD